MFKNSKIGKKNKRVKKCIKITIFQHPEKYDFLTNLYREMSYFSHLDNPRSEDLLLKIQQLNETDLTSKEKNNLNRIKGILHNLVTGKKFKMDENALKEYYKHYKKYTNVSITVDDRLSSYINSIFEAIFIEIPNLSHLMTYNRRTFESLNLRGLGFASIYKLLIKENKLDTNDHFKLALEVKSVMDSTEFKESSSDTKMLYYKLKMDFPLFIQNLIWEPCCIKSDSYGGKYFFAESDTAFLESPTSDRFVYAWNSTGRPRTSAWKFESYDRGETFYIRNVALNEYFYVGDGYHPSCSRCRKLYTRKSDKVPQEAKFKWRIPILTNKTQIKIASVQFPEDSLTIYWGAMQGMERFKPYVAPNNDWHFVEACSKLK